MSITYEEALSTLTAMFGSPWTQETLDAVLRHFNGHMENTVDAILGHGEGQPQDLITKLQSGTGVGGGGTAPGGGSDGGEHVDLDEEIARQLAADDKKRTGTRSGPGRGNRASGGARVAPAPTQPNKAKGRGTPTELPPTFLRIPGHSAKSQESQDEALARMLQDELFTQELANNPEFAHLARGGRGRAGTGSGRGFNYGAGSSRTNYQYPGRVGGQQHSGPNIIDKLSEMGENAKRRLALLAAQWNAGGANAGGSGGGGAGGSSGGTQERRGLLSDPHEGGNEEEISFDFARRSGGGRDGMEMSSMSSSAGAGKKDD